MSRRQIITRADIDRGRQGGVLPLLSTPAQLAGLLNVSKKTIYFWCSAGRLEGTYRKRGKYILFITDRALEAIFNGPEWESIV